MNLLCDFEELREPVRLVIVLDGNTAGVEEDQEDDGPVERLLLHHTTDDISERDSSGKDEESNPLLNPVLKI